MSAYTREEAMNAAAVTAESRRKAEQEAETAAATRRAAQMQALRKPGHRLDIISTGRGALFAECSCGHDYRATDNRRDRAHFADFERNKIRRMHQEHLANV